MASPSKKPEKKDDDQDMESPGPDVIIGSYNDHEICCDAIAPEFSGEEPEGDVEKK